MQTAEGNSRLTSKAFFNNFSIIYGLPLKEHLPKTQERLEQVCLEHHCERQLKLCDWSSTQASLFLLTGEAGIENVQGCGMHWYLNDLL